MDFKNFIAVCEQPEKVFERAPHFFIKVKHQHSLFFSLVIDRLKQAESLDFSALDVAILDSAALKAQLEMSFLGMKRSFIIYSSQDDSFDKELLKYLQTYQGENNFIVIIPDTTNLASGKQSFVIDPLIDKITYEVLVRTFGEHASLRDTRFIERLFQKSRVVELDSACLMMSYQAVVGRNTDLFFDTWYHRIYQPEQSLFALSTFLFARDAKSFYGAWSQCAHNYPSEFWVAYFSEQVWQAILFITTLEREGLVAARKVVNRLPFSFMQRDWKLTSVQQLTQLHSSLYDIDWSMKNGGSLSGIEILFAHYFLNK